MKLDSVGQALGNRILDLKDGRAANVIIGMPQRFPDGNDDFFCPFQIVGMGDERIRYAGGVDALQAVWLTLTMIAPFWKRARRAKAAPYPGSGKVISDLRATVARSLPSANAGSVYAGDAEHRLHNRLERLPY